MAVKDYCDYLTVQWNEEERNCRMISPSLNIVFHRMLYQSWWWSLLSCWLLQVLSLSMKNYFSKFLLQYIHDCGTTQFNWSFNNSSDWISIIRWNRQVQLRFFPVFDLRGAVSWGRHKDKKNKLFKINYSINVNPIM